MLSRLILKQTKVNSAVCIDYDEGAVDFLYQSAKTENPKIYPAVLDFINPITLDSEESPINRFLSDVVIALAVTHHLMLTQNIPLEYILETISRYSRKYIMVEFMPLGLYDGTCMPYVPPWYTIDRFRESFQNNFRLILEEQLEENRILFFGEKINSREL